MTCSKCKRPIPAGSGFCPVCGEKAPPVEVKPADVISVKLKLLFMRPLLIICLLAVTVLAPWQLLAAEDQSNLSGMFEDELRSYIYEDDLQPDTYYDYSTDTSRTEESEYDFAHENDFIDALYDESYVEPADTDETVRIFMIIMGLCCTLTAIGLWMVFLSVLRDDSKTISTTGFAAARVGIIAGVIMFVLLMVILLVRVSNLSTGANNFTAYSDLQDAVSTVCSGYIWMLLIAVVLSIVTAVLLQGSLRRLADSCTILVPDEISQGSSVICYVMAVVLLITGLVQERFVSFLLPVGVYIVIGVTLRYLRNELQVLSKEHVTLHAMTHKSRIIRPTD